ncbi:hypothetical protein Patl1_12224 [Pistacia atlantica]|uniref:Uncharacterized protein n=1 Tax=Pistacia atlantica TaxID=434234 RepID=A0ACC1A507_9ROSI|nr:hypothetical protein Patl1_12224 [Pistacia atlantica]
MVGSSAANMEAAVHLKVKLEELAEENREKEKIQTVSMIHCLGESELKVRAFKIDGMSHCELEKYMKKL